MRKTVSIIFLAVMSTGVFALGLGNIELQSGLNQPFNARIELLSPTPSELSSLTVRLADPEAFSRAGIDRAFILTALRFEIEESEVGADYIRITTREPLREPFLNFLLEANWSTGRIFREYTVLLDPPLYDPYAGRSAGPASPAVEPQLPSPAPAAVSPVAAPAPTITSFSGSQFGPVSQVDTLWSIANRVRPDESVSVQQMMLALLRANPEAFIGNNINGLRQGQILRVPDREDIMRSSSEQAMAEVRSQNAMWEQMRGTLAGSVTQQPVTTSPQPAAVSSSAFADTESELRLVAPGDQTAGTGTIAGVPSTDAGVSSGSIALLEEQLNTISSENLDLRDRLIETESLIDDLRRLIELKDDELAVLQQQLAEAGIDIQTGQALTQDDFTEEASVPVSEEMTSVLPTEEPAPAIATGPEEIAQETLTPTVQAPVQQGMVDKIIGFVMSNVMVVGGGAGLILLLALLAASRRKKAVAESDESVALTRFPDFDARADETEMPDSDGPEISVDDEEDRDEPEFEKDVVAADDDPEVPHEETAVADEAEEDPLAEVNVFLAYEHFDQAEEFVRDAIKKAPDNLDFHSKLLEVFYSSGDKVKYEEEARVLNGLVHGQGPHWEMATIMWQELSPNRPLFEAAEGDDDMEDITSSRGIVDLTAEDTSADDTGLDFDLGIDDGQATPAKDMAAEDVLDITSGSDDILDVTAADSGSVDDEDLLDVTAAVGLGSMDDHDDSSDDNLLDFEPEKTDEDIFDISATGAEDLLDVTAHTDPDVDDNEDLLDITSAGGMDEIDHMPESSDQSVPEEEDHSLDFDIGGIDMDAIGESGETQPETASDDENLLEFDSMIESSSNEDDGGIELDLGSEESTDNDDSLGLGLGDSDLPDETMEFSLATGSDEDDGGIELDLGSEESTDNDDSLGLGLGDSALPDETMEIRLDSDSLDSEGDIGLEFEGDADGESEVEFDLGLDDKDESPSAEIEMESTVKLTRNTLTLADDDEEADDDHTVFVPRTSDTGEQSTEDEIATRLDLAKAYVELGDGESAKLILEEVITEGNASQRQQAQELMDQIP